MSRKRAFPFVLVILLACSLLHCGGSKTTATPGGEDETQTQPDSESQGEAAQFSINITSTGFELTYAGTVILQLNAGNDLTVTENGSSTFATTLEEGDTYDVTIAQQPRFQNCVITGGQGTVAAANVTDVALNCSDKTWTHPQDSDDTINPPSEIAQHPKVAMDNNGNTIIAWYERDEDPGNDAYQTFISEYRNGAWTHPQSQIDNISPNGGSVYYPDVAMDDNGNALIAWYQEDDTEGDENTFKSEYRNGAWTHPANLDDTVTTLEFDDYPLVAMGNDGSAAILTAVWDTYEKLYINDYRNGAWNFPAAPDFLNLGGYTASNMDIAMDNDGNTIFVWTQRKDATTTRYIYKSEYRNGAWTHPTLLSDEFSPDGEHVNDPKVAMDDNGNAIIVWHQSDGTRSQIFMSEYRNGAWTHPANLLDNISPDATAAQDPQVAMSNNGEAMIVWEQGNGSGEDHIYMSHYRNGVWIHPTNLTEQISPAGGNCYVPQVAMDDDGNAVIVWRQRVGGPYHIFMSEYRQGVWTHPADTSDRISPDVTDDADNPQVAVDDNGNAVVTWDEVFSPGDDKIFMSEFR